MSQFARDYKRLFGELPRTPSGRADAPRRHHKTRSSARTGKPWLSPGRPRYTKRPGPRRPRPFSASPMPHAPALPDPSCATSTLRALDADTPPAHRPLPVCRVEGTQAWSGVDEVIEEVPVALVFNGISHAVLLATPADLDDLALGFSLSEGILDSRGELYDLECFGAAHGIELRLEIASSRFADLKTRRRNLAGRTGCGLCGVESLDALARPLAPVAAFTPIPIASVTLGLAELPAWQRLREITGAVHAAAWIGRDGHIRALREDVGRHNALDKLLGHLAREGVDRRDGFVPSARFTRRWRTASARTSSTVRLSSQPMQASVMLLPYSSSCPASGPGGLP
jgi:FdhD protein